jgi:hypothetical protein
MLIPMPIESCTARPQLSMPTKDNQPEATCAENMIQDIQPNLPPINNPHDRMLDPINHCIQEHILRRHSCSGANGFSCASFLCIPSSAIVLVLCSCEGRHDSGR